MLTTISLPFWFKHLFRCSNNTRTTILECNNDSLLKSRGVVWWSHDNSVDVSGQGFLRFIWLSLSWRASVLRSLKHSLAEHHTTRTSVILSSYSVHYDICFFQQSGCDWQPSWKLRHKNPASDVTKAYWLVSAFFISLLLLPCRFRAISVWKHSLGVLGLPLHLRMTSLSHAADVKSQSNFTSKPAWFSEGARHTHDDFPYSYPGRILHLKPCSHQTHLRIAKKPWDICRIAVRPSNDASDLSYMVCTMKQNI